MNWRKRVFDLTLASFLVMVIGPFLLVLLAYLLVREGRPLFYVADRMNTPNKSFKLWKLRTMTVMPHDRGVSGGDKSSRITKSGVWLRRLRMDEVPQLWNILIGDLSFVGPRPPLREYVEQFPEVYAAVLKSRPGVTGLATLRLHKLEERMLMQSQSEYETDDIYRRIFVPRKAELDLIYQQDQSIWYDIKLVYQTIGVLFERQVSGQQTPKFHRPYPWRFFLARAGWRATKSRS